MRRPFNGRADFLVELPTWQTGALSAGKQVPRGPVRRFDGVVTRDRSRSQNAHLGPGFDPSCRGTSDFCIRNLLTSVGRAVCRLAEPLLD
jgi:hypothetical protein